jgi:pimeloyl-ACP methyl ester carboxylesterase
MSGTVPDDRAAGRAALRGSTPPSRRATLARVDAELEAWRDEGSFFDFRGHRVFYRREGSGLPLLLIHGYPTSSFDWKELWPELTARFDVVAADMLGFGFSAKPRGHRYAIAEQAELQLALLERLSIREVHVLAHDYGDTVAQELLARNREGAPPALASMCLLNGGLFPETHRARPIQRVLASPIGPLVARLASARSFGRSMRAIFGPRTQPSDALLRRFWELASRDDGRLALAGLIRYMEERITHRERWVSAVVETRVPLRVIDGVLDPVSGAHMVERLLALRPGADVVRLDVGHYPQVEAPREVLAAFLAHVARATGR